MELRYLAENQPSLCIPRVFMNINEDRIRHVLDQVGLGRIDHIDILVRKSEKGDEYKRVFIHFSEWFWNKDAQAARTKLISGKEIKLVYDDPWFWKVSANNWQAPSVAKPVAPRPRIEFEEDDDRQHRVDRRSAPRDDRRPAPRAENRDSNYCRDDRRPAPRHDDRRLAPRHDDRRPAPRHDDRRPAPRDDQQRPRNNNQKNQHPLQAAATLPIAPTLTLPIAPALTPKPIAKTEPQSVGGLNLSYDAKMPAKRSLKLKTKPKKETAQLEFEEGEIIEVSGLPVTQEELKEIDDLYGDL
jgi:hypothetical protein